MTVYLYDKATNTKIDTFKNVCSVRSTDTHFEFTECGTSPIECPMVWSIPNYMVKIVVYGF